MKKLILTLILALVPGMTFAETVNLTWDANPEPNISGYEIYTGTVSGVYGAPVVVGKVTTNQMALNAGTYYIALKAVDSAGNKSDFSYEIKYVSKLSKVSGLGVK